MFFFKMGLYKIHVVCAVIQICFLDCILSDDPVVSTKYGDVSGKSIVLHTGAVIDTYLGIPFAKPPIGELRFQVRYMSKLNIHSA